MIVTRNFFWVKLAEASRKAPLNYPEHVSIHRQTHVSCCWCSSAVEKMKMVGKLKFPIFEFSLIYFCVGVSNVFAMINCRNLLSPIFHHFYKVILLILGSHRGWLIFCQITFLRTRKMKTLWRFFLSVGFGDTTGKWSTETNESVIPLLQASQPPHHGNATHEAEHRT